MPTERFKRLPEEKIEAIRRAGIQEFTRTSPESASINRIIQEADISRGASIHILRANTIFCGGSSATGSGSTTIFMSRIWRRTAGISG